MSWFKTYVCDLRFRNGLPVIITASAVDAEGTVHFAESYLLIPDEDCHLQQDTQSFDSAAIPQELLTIDDHFLHDESLRKAADVMLPEYLFQKHPEFYQREYPRYAYPPREQNRNLLVSLWLRDNCREALREIGRKTKCKDLARFIELLGETFTA